MEYIQSFFIKSKVEETKCDLCERENIEITKYINFSNGKEETFCTKCLNKIKMFETIFKEKQLCNQETTMLVHN